MKTTVEIPDALFREAQEYAVRHGLARREVCARGLQLVVREKPLAPRRMIALRPATHP